MSLAHDPWAVVLAGGSGTRLSALSTRADGVAVPKQFCSLRGGPSLLQETVERARQIVPLQRVLVVVTEAHAAWWRPQLAMLPPENVLSQPDNRGTAAALLLATAAILRRDPRARLCVLPSDHYVAAPKPLLATLQRALHRTAIDRQRVFLLGMAPDGPDTEYGWIVAGRERHGILAVERFVEKPELPRATELWQRGALWHSFVVAADARALWKLGERTCAEVGRRIAAIDAAPDALAAALAADYRELPVLDFARHMLPGNEAALGVLRVPPCGWTDLGTPARLRECLLRGDGGAVLRAVGTGRVGEDAVDLEVAARQHHLLVD